ncbi:MAG: succinate dehydrogenase/fumarate reductase iron-sulfur subunit [Candidatus Marsarchaeota archaeon]|nr:succinate dehydrogenase/fumarate reductase iron-sulfur subunit [Candidatus Marsarchaeota archaeon]MCL5413184.1 succinate dehydrogenase/fumarate reductase iron-sulfur subunit [Candidatus Marsarchaeota archaeon]
MKASRYDIFMYGSIIGVPVLLILITIGLYLGGGYAYTVTVLAALLVLTLVVFAATGIKEIYIHRTYPGSRKVFGRGTDEHASTKPKVRKGEEVDIVLDRFNNETSKMDTKTYKFYADRLTTVLGAILDIKAYQDNTVSIRCNCRMGICGSCGVVVNGKPRLACETNLLNAVENRRVRVSPMLGHPLLKDMANNFEDFFEKHRSVEPFLYREDERERESARHEYGQGSEDLSRFLPYSYCIMCGLCLDACPVVNSNPNFAGPQALSQVWRYYADSRDQKGKKRLFDVDTEEGAWGCEFSGSCSKACPKGVGPASAIQMMKGELMKRIFEDK